MQLGQERPYPQTRQLREILERIYISLSIILHALFYTTFETPASTPSTKLSYNLIQPYAKHLNKMSQYCIY